MNKAKDLWEKMQPSLEISVSAVNYEVWLKPLEPLTIVDDRLVLAAPSEGGRQFIASHFCEQLNSALKEVMTMMNDVIIVGPDSADTYREKDEPSGETSEQSPPKIEANFINPKYNFENFVVGKSNQYMYAAAHAVADEPGVRYNPLFIYGGAGLGKTHIMHAIGNNIRLSHPHLKVLYASSEKFVNEFIESIRTTKGKSTSFREKYRSVDVLMIDDIQFIADKAGTQEELFHTFNDLHEHNKQIILTSDRPPKEISPLEERLRTRFEWGLIVDVQAPDLETRIAILQKKAQAARYNIPFDVLRFMAEKMPGNVRDMESLLNKVTFSSRLSGLPISVELVTDALKDYSEPTEESVTAERIIDCVCKYFNVSKDDLVGKKKTKEIVEPRHICMYLLIDMLALPQNTICEILHRSDHTTVINARNRITERMNTNARTRTAVNDIKDMVLRK